LNNVQEDNAVKVKKVKVLYVECLSDAIRVHCDTDTKNEYNATILAVSYTAL